MIRVCAWCGKVNIGGKWIIAKVGKTIAVTHGICPMCDADMRKGIESASTSKRTNESKEDFNREIRFQGGPAETIGFE